MGWLEGLLTGYQQRHYAIEAQKREEAGLAAEREGRVFQALMNSEDPEVKLLAQAGMLASTDPKRKKGGIAGWMGEVERSPYMEMIQRYQAGEGGEGGEGTDLNIPGQPSVPKVSGAIPTAPAPTNSAALPATSPVTPGAPHLTQPVFAPGAGSAAEPPPPPTFSLSPGGPPRPSGMPGATPPPNLRPGAPGGIPAAAAGGTGQLLGGAGMMASNAATQPAGLMQPGVGSSAPPPPPSLPQGMVQPGMPGAPPSPPRGHTTLSPSGPPRRTRISIFPTPDELQERTVRAGVRGTIGGLTEMYLAKGMSEQEARIAAADTYEDMHVRSGSSSGAPFRPMEFDVTDPATNQTERVYGWLDVRSGQQLDAQHQPLTGKVSRALPYSAITGDVYRKDAIQQLGYDPNDVAHDPAKARQVSALAHQLAGDRAAATTTQRLGATQDAGLMPGPKASLVARYQASWNAIQAPVRNMEMFLRTMKQSYARYKAGDRAAWEPLRTAFVHVSEPNSVVMPSEFTRSANVGSLLEQIYGYVGKTLEGGAPLPDEIIDQMMRIADDVWKGAATFGSQQKAAITAAISDPAVNIPVDQVFGPAHLRYDPSAPPPPAGAAPVVQPAATPGAVPGATGTKAVKDANGNWVITVPGG